VVILEILEKLMENSENLVERLRKRATIRRSIPTRKSVQQGETDRISNILEEAADEIDKLIGELAHYDTVVLEQAK
jgi:hypothetical protein